MSADIETKELGAFQKKIKDAIFERDKGEKFEKAMRECLMLISTQAKTKYLTSGPLHVRTGLLRASLRESVKRSKGQVVGSVGTDVFYGRVWEFGAQTPGHIVKPVNTDPRTGRVFDYLKFRLGPYGPHGAGMGSWVSVRSVRMDPKPWLGPAIRDMTPRIRELIAKVSKETTVKD